MIGLNVFFFSSVVVRIKIDGRFHSVNYKVNCIFFVSGLCMAYALLLRAIPL